jgi:predicted lysophospholipase L1 biosynthesis ABC-type transport system permease subunit
VRRRAVSFLEGEERWVEIIKNFITAVSHQEQMVKHDFPYVSFTAALGAFCVFLMAGLALDDHILIIFGGVCLGLVLIASIVYMINWLAVRNMSRDSMRTATSLPSGV